MIAISSKIKAFIKKALDHYSAIIISIIPVIIVASLLGAVINIVQQIPMINGESLATAYPVLKTWCDLLSVFNNCGIFMIPVYIIWSTVRHFHGNELYAIFVGLTLVSAEITNGLSLRTAIADGNVVYWELGFMSIPKAGFQGQILISIIAGVFLVTLERWITKRTPRLLQIFVVPFVCILSTCLFAYLLVGPAARGLEQILANIFTYLLNEPEFKNLSGFILGLCQLPMMLFGIHLVLMPINLQQVMSAQGSPIWPINVTSVLSAGGAALAVFVFYKDKELRDKAREGSLVTLALGSVEPALFGVCTKNKCAMIGAITSAALSGLLCRILNISATSFGLNGFMSFLNIPLGQWSVYAIAISVSILGGFFSTALLLRLTKHNTKDNIENRQQG